MERREALGSHAEGPPPRDPHHPQNVGSRNLGVQAAPLAPPCGSLASSLAPPGAPSPQGKRKKGKTGAERLKTTGGEALANRSAAPITSRKIPRRSSPCTTFVGSRKRQGFRRRARAARRCRAKRDKLIAIDERRRAAILKFEQAQARRNAASKEIGQAKAKKDEATAQQADGRGQRAEGNAAGARSGVEGGRGGTRQDPRHHPEPAARRSAGRQGRDMATSSITSGARSATTRSRPSSISNWAKRSA